MNSQLITIKITIMSKNKTAINPTRSQDYPKWYQEVIKAADLAENSVARGCMVIKPWGYSIWEFIKEELDKKIKETGHQNFYFPMFVPLSFMAKEAEHVEGFAKECAVVTHHRLETDSEKGLVPAGELEEPLIIRPTSEAIIGEAYSRWINSYRDLPLLGNQWANVVRWEMRPRIFLRTSEFLWQEGHTAHAHSHEAMEEAEKMLEVYRELCEEFLGIAVILGMKTESEKFPGADITYTLESMMQDKKALQSGTSHFLGQNFAKAFNIKYLSKEGKQEYVWTTSWGVTTRLIGALIMTHSDDNGLVLPPTIAPFHVVIVPIIHKDQDQESIMSYCSEISDKLSQQKFHGKDLRIHIDKQEKSAGERIWGWVKKGVPIRIEIGKKEIEANCVFLARRDQEPSDKNSLDKEQFVNTCTSILSQIQNNITKKAKDFLESNIVLAKNKQEFEKLFNNEAEQPGFVKAFWIGDLQTEKELKEKFKVTSRCIALSDKNQTGKCIFTGKDGAKLVIFARAY
jgi:prolyl-tRNA synthetase